VTDLLHDKAHSVRTDLLLPIDGLDQKTSRLCNVTWGMQFPENPFEPCI